MNPSRRNRLPSYRLHKPSGRAVVTLGPRDVYLGPHGTEESRRASERAIAEWLATGRTAADQSATARTVNQIVAAYWRHATGYYVKNGRPTSQQARVRGALDRVCRLYGDQPATAFGPLALKAVRQQMVTDGWARTYVNSCIGCVKLCFKWTASEELVPPAVYDAIRTVAGLRRGRTEAREPEPVRPVPEADFRAVLSFLPAPLRAVAELQWLTGMRSGEVLQMRPADVDRTGDVWQYRPRSHKTEHHGECLPVLLSAAAQAVLAPWLLRGAESNCFRPVEAAVARAPGHAHRRDSRTPGEQYHPTTYARAVGRACRRAGVKHWHPHRLRHAAATRFAAAADPDVARILLRHRDLGATRLYLEDSIQKAADALRKIG
jgi:integrase